MGVLRHFARHNLLQMRIFGLTTIATAVAIVASNLIAYGALQNALVHASENIAEAIADEISDDASASLGRTGELGESARQAGGVLVEAIRSDGTVSLAPGQARGLVVEARDVDVARSTNVQVRRTGEDPSGTRYIVVVAPLALPGHALLVARPMAPILEILAAEREILGSVAAGTVLATIIVAGMASYTGLRPVRQLTAAVEHVTRTKDFQTIYLPRATGELGVLTSAFNDMLRAVSDMREMQDRLVADASHELRTPLTSLTTNVELLTSDAGVDLIAPAARSQILHDVRSQLAELTSLVGDLMHLTRNDAATRFQLLDLRDIVRSAVDRVQPRSAGRSLDVDTDAFYLNGDASSLERAVINLLDNAIKWSPPGSVITVTLRGNCLAVTDSGPGVPAKDLPYVFDRFFRGETARHTPGTGLGLSIVAKAAKDHGGTARAESAPTGGARFSLQFPGATNSEALVGAVRAAV